MEQQEKQTRTSPSAKLYAGYLIIFFLLVLAVVVPGYLFIFLFEKGVFITMDLIRVSILSLGITLPILTLNLAHFLHSYNTDDTDYNFLNAIYRAEVFSILVLYVPLIIGYFFSWNTLYGVVSIILLQTFVSSILFFTRIREVV